MIHGAAAWEKLHFVTRQLYPSNDKRFRATQFLDFLTRSQANVYEDRDKTLAKLNSEEDRVLLAQMESEEVGRDLLRAKARGMGGGLKGGSSKLDGHAPALQVEEMDHGVGV